MSRNKAKLLKVLLFLYLVFFFSGCLIQYPDPGTCPPSYGFELIKMKFSSEIAYHNLTEMEINTLPILGQTIPNFVNESVSHVTINDVSYNDWKNTITKMNEISKLDIDPYESSWYFSYNMTYFEIIAFTIVC